MKTIVMAQNIYKEYRLGSFPRRTVIKAVNHINFKVESDRPVIISIVGESGSGKTTLAKVILRLVEPNSGEVIIADKTVVGKDAKPNKSDFYRTVQPIFQNPFDAFNRYRTVDSYLYETAVHVARLGSADALQAVKEALSVVGLEYKDVHGKYPNQFSGGELQRASVARALIPHPSLIVADEPVSMIDASWRMIIINLFLALKQEFNSSFLYITHDLATAYYISDYIAVMNKGTIVEFGDVKSVFSNPQHAYTQLLLDSIPAIDHKWVPAVQV